MPNAVVTLKKGAGRTLKQGGPWIYDNEVESIMGNFTDGDIVLVHDFDGYPLGRGFINRNSKLTVRMMTRDRDTEVDESFLRMRSSGRRTSCPGLWWTSSRTCLSWSPWHLGSTGSR